MTPRESPAPAMQPKSASKLALLKAMLMTFAGFCVLFGALFSLIRGHPISNAEFVVVVAGMSALITLVGFTGAWLMWRYQGPNAPRNPD